MKNNELLETVRDMLSKWDTVWAQVKKQNPNFSDQQIYESVSRIINYSLGIDYKNGGII